MKEFHIDLAKRLDICAERAGGRKALALASDISFPQLYRYIKGIAVIPTDRLLNIARASNVHPFWLLTGEGSPDIPAIRSFLSPEQLITIDAKSLVESLTLAEQIDRDYNLKLAPSRKADFVLALYQGITFEAKLFNEPSKFESSKALEIYGYLASILGELPRKMILNTIEIITKVSSNLLPDKEIRTFCNYLNTAIRDYYNHPTLAQPYYDRIGYTLENDTAERITELLAEVKNRHLYRNEQIQILDLGCGNGRHLLHFAKDSRLKAVGLDNNNLSKQICIQYEQAGRLPAGSFVQGDIFNLPFKDNSFDFIFANGSLFHTPFFVESPHGLNHVMREIKRVLRPKGEVYIHSRYGSGFEPFPFYQFHNEGSIRQLCQKNGFQMIWFKKFFWQDSIEIIPKVRFNDWFGALLVKAS